MSRVQKTYDIFVGNLPKDATDKTVGKLFSKLGEIATIIIRDSNQSSTGQRIAYVKFLCDGDAERAANEMNGQMYEGKKLMVRRSEVRKRASGGVTSTGSSSGVSEVTNAGINSVTTGGAFGGMISPFNSTASALNSNNTYCGGYSNAAEPRSLFAKGPDILPVNAFDTKTEVIPKPQMNKKKGFDDVTQPTLATCNVLGTYVENPGVIWGQIISEENKNKLTELVTELQRLCPAAQVVAKPDRNKVYGALYNEDGLWYRCCVKQIGPDQVEVQYLDYGNSELVPLNGLVELPTSLSCLKPFAQKYILHNLRAKDPNDKTAINFLRTCTEGKVLIVQPTKGIAGGGSFAIVHQLKDDKTVGDNVGDLLLEKGFCETKMGPSLKGSGDQSPKMNSEAPQPLLQIKFNKGSQERQMDKSKKDSSEADRKRDEKERQMKAELTKLRREIEQVKNEKDLVVLDLNNTKGKLKTMQTDNLALSTKLTNSSLSKKINAVVGLAKKIAKLRNHFPRNQPSRLEQSIQLTSGSGKIHTSSISSLSSVSSALNTYRAAQKEITQCCDKAELEELVQARDEARQLLHQKLVICLSELNSLPMEERKQALFETHKSLERTYSSYGTLMVHSCPKLCDLESSFDDWIARRKIEFEEVRNYTDETKMAVTTALCNLQKALSLSMTDSEEEMDSKDYLEMDQHMMRYTQTLQTEINITDLEHNKESSFVSSLLYALKQEIASETNIIENMMMMRDEFEVMKNTNEPWLYKHPELEKLTDLKKPLRSLKSKLRHSLADKEDALENDGSQNEEMELIVNEINSLQKEIHSILLEEDNIIIELSVISEDHFPELKVQHPELGFESNLKYSGLLKTNREIDYYLLTPTSRAGLSTSTFCGDQVFIREFLIGDEQASKDALMERAILFNQDCPNLQSIDAVFLSKSGRQIYIQTPNKNYKTLEQLVKENILSDQDKQKVLNGVATGLKVLHSRGFVYGELHPTNVLVNQDSEALLLEPDLSKTAAERWSKSYYCSPNGLNFLPPESLEYVAPSADMYCFGILSLWLHYPHSYFEKKSNFTPDISGIFMDFQLGKMVQNLILGAPEVRLTAERLLQSEYMTSKIKERRAKTPPKAEQSKETSDSNPASESSSLSHPDVIPVDASSMDEKSDSINDKSDNANSVTDKTCDNVELSDQREQSVNKQTVPGGDSCNEKFETPLPDDSDSFQSDNEWESDKNGDVEDDEPVKENDGSQSGKETPPMG